jgi:hypothetical protein
MIPFCKFGAGLRLKKIFDAKIKKEIVAFNLSLINAFLAYETLSYCFQVNQLNIGRLPPDVSD